MLSLSSSDGEHDLKEYDEYRQHWIMTLEGNAEVKEINSANVKSYEQYITEENQRKIR